MRKGDVVRMHYPCANGGNYIDTEDGGTLPSFVGMMAWVKSINDGETVLLHPSGHTSHWSHGPASMGKWWEVVEAKNA